MRLPLQSLFDTRSFSLRDPALSRLLWGTGATTAAGVAVSEDSALNLAAFWRGVQLLGGQVGAMPLHLYKGGRVWIKVRYTGSKLYKLLHDAPNREMTAFSFRESLQGHLLTWGNAYAEIEWTNGGQPLGLWPITPDRVTVYRDAADQQIKYRVAPSNRTIAAEDMLHIPGLGFDGLIGYSVIARARQSLGLTAAAERYGSTFYGNGATFGGTLTTPDDLDEDQRKELRADIDRLHQGPDRAHKFLLLYNGLKYDRLAIPPNDAQFLETRKHQVVEIARWLGLPPHKLYDLERSTNNNIEQQGIDYYTDTVWMWLEKWEQELNRKLIPSLETNYQFFEFDFNGIMRADTKARFEAYQIGRQGGWYSINDIKRKENENPIGVEGDIYLAPLNMIPLDKFAAYTEKKLNPPTPAPAAAVVPLAVDPALEEKAAAAQQRADRAEAAALEARQQAATLAAEAAELRARDVVPAAEYAVAQAAAEAARALAEQLTADRLELQREATRLQGLYEAEQVAHRIEQQRAEVAETAGAAATAQQVATETELTTTRAQWQQERTDWERQLQEARAALEARQAEVQTLTVDLAGARTMEHELATAAGLRLAELNEATRQAEATDEALAALTTRAAALVDPALVAAAETAAAEAATRALAAETALTGATEALAGAQAALAAAEAARGGAMAQAEAAAATAQAAEQRAAAADQRLGDIAAAELDWVGRALVNRRSRVVGVMRRKIDRETDRLYRSHGSVEKLRAWIESFYPNFEAECVEALQEHVEDHLIAMRREDSAEVLTRQLVSEHIEHSKRDLARMLEDVRTDGGELTAAVNHVIESWKRDRVERIATRLLQQEIDHYVRAIRA